MKGGAEQDFVWVIFRHAWSVISLGLNCSAGVCISELSVMVFGSDCFDVRIFKVRSFDHPDVSRGTILERGLVIPMIGCVESPRS